MASHIGRRKFCAMGEIELTMLQIRAIEILLRKCLPDLAAVEIQPEQTHRYVIEVPGMLSEDEWQKKYSPPTSEGKAEAEETKDLPSLADIRKLQ
jgi:hypothetical protein